MRLRIDKDFISMFDERNGHYFRSGAIKDGAETKEDPFMSSFPELLDVGIMGHCAHGRSGLCVAAGVECYQDGLHADAPNMALEDLKKLSGSAKAIRIKLPWEAAVTQSNTNILGKSWWPVGSPASCRTSPPRAWG